MKNSYGTSVPQVAERSPSLQPHSGILSPWNSIPTSLPLSHTPLHHQFANDCWAK